jgi:hypothetical protein
VLSAFQKSDLLNQKINTMSKEVKSVEYGLENILGAQDFFPY